MSPKWRIQFILYVTHVHNINSAQISTNDDLYHIVPLDDTLNGQQRAYRESDSVRPDYTYGQFSRIYSSNVAVECEYLNVSGINYYSITTDVFI